MGDITVAADCAVDGQQVVVVGQLPAGAALTAGMPVRISGGYLYPADADVCSETNVSAFCGFAVDDVASGMGASAYGQGTILRDYSTGLTSGKPLYVSASVGQITDVKAASSDKPVAVAINSTDILIVAGQA